MQENKKDKGTHFALHHNLHLSRLHNVEAISHIALVIEQPMIVMISDTIASVRVLIFSSALLLQGYNCTCCVFVGSFRHAVAAQVCV